MKKIIAVSISVVGLTMTLSSCGNSKAEDYWNSRSDEVKQFACQTGASTAAGVEWEPSMDFSLSDLESAIAKSC